MIMRNMTNMLTNKPCIQPQFLFNHAMQSNYNYQTTEPAMTHILVAHNIHFYSRIALTMLQKPTIHSKGFFFENPEHNILSKYMGIHEKTRGRTIRPNFK